jgi:predicted nuclease of predicted toxin-antitoxin system
MRLLAENFSEATIQALRHDGHDVQYVRTSCPIERDPSLLDNAECEGRIVLTFDQNLWQFALQRRRPLQKAGVLLLRIQPAAPDAVTSFVRQALAGQRVWSGHVSIVSVDGVEMIPSR